MEGEARVEEEREVEVGSGAEERRVDEGRAKEGRAEEGSVEEGRPEEGLGEGEGEESTPNFIFLRFRILENFKLQNGHLV